MRVLLLLSTVASAAFCCMQAGAQATHATVRDAFWSASDLISVTPNPAAHLHRTSVRGKRGDEDGPNKVPSPTTGAGAAPAQTKNALALVSENGYGAAPHLLPASANRDRLGLRYSLLLQGAGGEYNEVGADATFHSGDHIRLSLLANQPGYLYVIERGSSGSWVPIFPPIHSSESDHIAQGSLQQVPSGTRSFQFDQNAGEETLFVILSTTPIADIERVMQNLKGGDKPAEQPAAPEPASTAPLLEAANRIPDELVQRLASRDLVLVDEEKVSQPATATHDGEKAVYVVSKPGVDPSQVVARIVLHHE